MIAFAEFCMIQLLQTIPDGSDMPEIAWEDVCRIQKILQKQVKLNEHENQTIKRDSNEYRLAEKIVHLEDALKTANQELNKLGKFGVLPNRSVDFKDGSEFHKRVRDIIKGT